MPSQRRTKKSKNAGRKQDDFREQHEPVDREHDPADGEQRVDEHRHGDIDGQPQRWRRVGVPVPPASVISTVSALSGGSGLTAAIITGQVQASVVWPAVTLVIAGMVYDVARQALHRGRRA
ncbi:hypothetical protein [Streptomyces sp. BSE6.1]|uniref:hypothetical protein n=1 Tax=Streptomyces sp. BSE6.1 TaxID=2605730 RepID=UPI001F289470|nr:hypothetical protein [Streptomyces sp. BSE6.1]